MLHCGRNTIWLYLQNQCQKVIINDEKTVDFIDFLTLVACSNKQVMLGKKCLKEVNGNETITTKSYIWFVNKDHDWSSDLTKVIANE